LKKTTFSNLKLEHWGVFFLFLRAFFHVSITPFVLTLPYTSGANSRAHPEILYTHTHTHTPLLFIQKIQEKPCIFVKKKNQRVLAPPEKRSHFSKESKTGAV
jgi:hypothetical protein